MTLVECVCEQCGKTFNVPHYRIAKHRVRYCSKPCKGIATHNDNKVDCVCSQCGKPFFINKSKFEQGRGKYCSKSCTGIAFNQKVERTCGVCGAAFKIKPHQIKDGGGKYCSKECSNLGRTKKVECVCQQCGIHFMIAPTYIKQGRGKYCSIECVGLAQRREGNPRWLGGRNGDRGPNWYQQRKLAYARDKGICQHCGKKPRKGKRQFNVHHIKPFREFNGDYIKANDLINLITLCHQCHQPAECGLIPIQPYLF